jgi:hypothetical protein
VGLFELIAEHPDGMIVLDDLVTILRSDVALQILLSALEHPARDDRTRSRVVKYRRKGVEERVAFRGGIICIGNRMSECRMKSCRTRTGTPASPSMVFALFRSAWKSA